MTRDGDGCAVPHDGLELWHATQSNEYLMLSTVFRQWKHKPGRPYRRPML